MLFTYSSLGSKQRSQKKRVQLLEPNSDLSQRSFKQIFLHRSNRVSPNFLLIYTGRREIRIRTCCLVLFVLNY